MHPMGGLPWRRFSSAWRKPPAFPQPPLVAAWLLKLWLQGCVTHPPAPLPPSAAQVLVCTLLGTGNTCMGFQKIATSCQQRGGGSVGRGGGFNPEVSTMILPESCGCTVSSFKLPSRDRPSALREGLVTPGTGTLGKRPRRRRRSAVSFGPPEGAEGVAGAFWPLAAVRGSVDKWLCSRLSGSLGKLCAK